MFKHLKAKKVVYIGCKIEASFKQVESICEITEVVYLREKNQYV